MQLASGGRQVLSHGCVLVQSVRCRLGRISEPRWLRTIDPFQPDQTATPSLHTGIQGTCTEMDGWTSELLRARKPSQGCPAHPLRQQKIRTESSSDGAKGATIWNAPCHICPMFAGRSWRYWQRKAGAVGHDPARHLDRSQGSRVRKQCLGHEQISNQGWIAPQVRRVRCACSRGRVSGEGLGHLIS